MASVMKTSQPYLAYFVKNNRPGPVASDTVKTIKGTCSTMCPQEEIILRKRERMVHILEVVGDNQKLVKCYSRPAADTNLAIAHNLRPFHVLKKTINYLLFEVTKREDVSQLTIYNFVTDRLRAVRQDMIIQDLEPELRISLLEPMIRFHIYYGYLLCEEAINDYSPTLNRNILLECLKTCLYCYDAIEFSKAMKAHDVSILANDMGKCNIDENGLQPGHSRELMEALYVLTNLYEESPMWRLCRLSEDIWHAPPVRLAYKLASAALSGHYVTVSKSLSSLCPLMFCAVALFLPILQRRALRTLCAAYGTRASGGVPVSAVRAWLGFAHEAAARAALAHCGLAERSGWMQCARAALRDDAPPLPPTKIPADHMKDKMNIDYILTYTPSKT